MRVFQLSVSAEGQPLYLRIAQAMRQSILDGRLLPGEATPSTRELARNLDTHRNTVIAAFSELLAEGWITAEQRKSYRVSRELPSDFSGHSGQAKRSAPAPVAAFKWQLVRESWLEPIQPEQPVPYAFRWGFADPSLFPLREFRSHMLDVLRKPKAALFDYGSPRGIPSLLAAIEEYLRRLRGIEGRSIFITNGTGEALLLLSQLLLAPGDRVAMEDPGYPPARELFRVMGVKIDFVQVGADGLDLGLFEKLAARRKIKLLFLTPLHQFPSTATMPMPKRMRLYEIASRHGVAIFEEDYDHEIHYLTQPLPPLASQDPEGRVLYAGTFSKILFPSARVGFVAVPRELETPLIQLRRLSTHQNEAVMQDALARWMASGGVERHVRRMRRHYHGQRDALIAALGAAQARGAKIDWRDPEGGMALWLDTHRDSRTFAREALERGVLVAPEWVYRSNGKGTHVRLGFSTMTSDQLQLGIKALEPLFTRR
ncbi:MAG: PLP-dependent aminotransferase family protein [Deltaproteobacteria bacterium]|nr:PLP-dependent aminotransferase family protein [Deltaproteobacteria bacterium]